MTVRWFPRGKVGISALPPAEGLSNARLWHPAQVHRVRADALHPDGTMRDDFLSAMIARANEARPWLIDYAAQGAALWLASLATALREALLGRLLRQSIYVNETLRTLRQMCPTAKDAKRVDSMLRNIGPAGIEDAVRDFLTAALTKAAAPCDLEASK